MTTNATGRSAPLTKNGADASRAAQAPQENGCRVMQMTGSAPTRDGKPITKGEILNRATWLDLDEGAQLTVKHTRSGRELSVQGKSRVMLCLHGEEQALLAHGTIRTSTGSGVRPGAEVLLATPFGVVRYPDAMLELRVADNAATVKVASGTASVDPTPRAGNSQETTISLSGPDGTHQLAPPLPTPEAHIRHCRKAAELADQSGHEVLVAPSGVDAGSLGERAAKHVRLRRTARSACASAAAATGLIQDHGKSQQHWAEVLRWEGLWRALPRDPSRKKK